jgi:hypothetical protein
MKQALVLVVMAIFGIVMFSSCEEKEIEKGREYPAGSTVWKKDSVVVLTDHYVIQPNKSLYIEEGVTIIFDNPEVGPEFIVLGNLYSYGTKEKPVRFTVPTAIRNDANRFERTWGGIICGYDSEEVLLLNTIIEYSGAQTTENSASIQFQLFKTKTGEGVPAFHACNTAGKVVIQNCIFRNNAEDHIYITGGQSILSNNTFIANGFDGGEAINYKSGCLADIAFNLIYDANSNGLKLSNSAALSPHSHLFCYNNTIVNSGWRRPSVKGGSIWLEDNIITELYNNLLVDVRWPVKRDNRKKEHDACVITPTYYFSSTAIGVEQMKADSASGRLNGPRDILSMTAGDKNPNFKNFTQQSVMNLNAGPTGEGIPVYFNDSWDFHLSSGSPAAMGGTTAFNRHWGTTGLTLDGVEYKSPAPATYFGAFPVK